MILDDTYYKGITEQIIGCAYTVANCLGPGFLEKVYENALCYEIEKTTLELAQQQSIRVMYQNIVVGVYYADLLVQDEVVVELKTVKKLEASHFAQCMNYLKASGKRVGLLINFGSEKVEIRRVINSSGKGVVEKSIE